MSMKTTSEANESAHEALCEFEFVGLTPNLCDLILEMHQYRESIWQSA